MFQPEKRKQGLVGALFIFLPAFALFTAQAPIVLQEILLMLIVIGGILFYTSRYKERRDFSEEQATKQWDKQKGKCRKCGDRLKEHAFHRHHKDGNRSNIKSSNLELWCANCHSIETYNILRHKRKSFWF